MNNRLSCLLSDHDWTSVDSPIAANGFAERIRCRRCGATATSFPTEIPHRVAIDKTPAGDADDE